MRKVGSELLQTQLLQELLQFGGKIEFISPLMCVNIRDNQENCGQTFAEKLRN